MMKAMKSLVLAAMAAAGLAVAANAQAAGHSGWSGGHVAGGFSGHRGFCCGHRFFSGPRVGFFIGAPVLYGSWYWNYPYDYYYPYYPRTVVYPDAYPEGAMEPAPTTEVPRMEGAPPQAPAYMNYCQSANAYFPKVTTCPEGWKFVPSR
jgi:hypothetical protein